MLADKFKDLNIRWLITGEGEPWLLSGDKTEEPSSVYQVANGNGNHQNVDVTPREYESLRREIETLHRLIQEKDERISLLKEMMNR